MPHQVDLFVLGWPGRNASAMHGQQPKTDEHARQRYEEVSDVLGVIEQRVVRERWFSLIGTNEELEDCQCD